MVAFFFSEEDFNVLTSCVAVDFSVGRDTYNLIWESIKDKEIGVLGVYIFDKVGFEKMFHKACLQLF